VAVHYPYRERTERVIAVARVALALFSLPAVWLDQGQPTRYTAAGYGLLAGYVLFAMAIGLIAWRVRRPIRGFQVTTHAVDLVVVMTMMYLTGGTRSPFYVYLIFALMVATLRWRTRGAAVTTAVSLVAFLALGLLTEQVVRGPDFQLSRFVIRVIYLCIAAALLAQFERFEQAVRSELERLAHWRRPSPTDMTTLLESSLPEALSIMGAQRALLVWDEVEEPSRFVVYATRDNVELTRRAPDAYGSIVMPDLIDAPFIYFDKPGVVVLVESGKMRSTRGEGMDAALRREFSITDFVSVPLAGGDLRGRLFFLEHPAAVADSVFLAEVIATELLARMETVRVSNDLRQAAVRDQRMQTALELHDGLLQSLTAAGLEVGTAARELTSDMARTREKLLRAEELISRERRELRALIDELRPGPTELQPFALDARLAELQELFPLQWGLKVKVAVDPDTLRRCSQEGRDVARDVYFLAHEGLVNAARHACASVAEISISSGNGTLHLCISDDGQGFPVRGRYTLEELEGLGVEPVMLSRRVRSLSGELVLHSSSEGSRIEIDLPGALG
jgi:signal transduction histidine kinase